MKFDYTIVGCGLFGSVFAREMTDAGYKCQIIDKRPHIGGNVYTENVKGINVHRYGPHIFHTDSDYVWNYVNKFVNFNNFRYRPKVFYQDRFYSFPINLMTLHQVFPRDVKTPLDVEYIIDYDKDINDGHRRNPSNLEDWAINEIGPTLYNIFIKGYTEKQWGIPAKELPASIIKRLPIRSTFDETYFKNAKYEGIPIGGYTQLVENLIKYIPVTLNVDISPSDYSKEMGTVVWTGPIDKFFDSCYTDLQYRSLRFEDEEYDYNYQGVAVVNYTDRAIPYTRIIEHKFFDMNDKNGYSLITKEYPSKDGDPYYPIRDEKNIALLKQYQAIKPDIPVIFGGRLGTYQYYDMDQVIAQALDYVKKQLLR